jgi:hypothetical protein
MGTARIYVEKTVPSSVFAVEADWVGQNWNENFSVLGMWLINRVGPGGSTGSFQGGEGYQNLHANGYVGEHRGNPFMPGGYGQNATRWNDYYEKRFYHDGNGYHGGVSLGMELGYGGINDRYDNGRAHQGSIGAPGRIPKPPSAPRNLSVSGVTPTNGGITYNEPADWRGSSWQRYVADWYEIVPGGDPIRVWTDVNSNGYTSPNNGQSPNGAPVLKPSTRYDIYIYAQTNVGNGEAAGISFTTAPSGPPKVQVFPTVSGTSARAIMTPPDNVSGVREWVFRQRPADDPSAVVQFNHNGSTLDFTSLTPGRAYEYQVLVVLNGYTSPASDWLRVVQPNPNTNPGNFFDGSTAATPSQRYVWDGATNNSPSRALAFMVAGWRAFAECNGTSGGTGVVSQIEGGIVGTKAARAIFFTDATGAGFAFGTGSNTQEMARVAATSLYFGSLFVRLSRSQRMAARLDWYNSFGQYLSSTLGTPQVVAANTVTRLISSGPAPANAAYAAVRAIDVTGTGWATWKGGDWFVADAAMVSLQEIYPYFDGSTPDTDIYTYSWESETSIHASPSIRRVNPNTVIDLLADPDCPPPRRPPAAPMINDECIVEVGTWLRYWVTIPKEEIASWNKMLLTLRVKTGGSDTRQVRIRTYSNPDNLTPGGLDATRWDAEQIISYIPANSEIELNGVDQRAWARVNGSEPVPADKLLFGSNSTPASWPVLSCNIGYLVSFEVPIDAPAGNVDVDVELTRRV